MCRPLHLTHGPIERHQVVNRTRVREIPYYMAQSLFSGDATGMAFESFSPTDGTRRRYVLALTDGVLAVNGMVLGVEVRGLRISYFGQTTGSTSRQWHSTWHDPIRIPELVRAEWESASVSLGSLTKEKFKAVLVQSMICSSVTP